MALRLIVMRHAKSSWKSGAASDHARPLNKRGRRDAPRVAARLRELGWLPTHVLCSDAARTTETLERMTPISETGPGALHVELLPQLYHGGAEAASEALAALDPQVTCALILGHNPGWEELVTHLCGEAVTLPTAAAALLETDATQWAAAVAEPGRWRLVSTLRPRSLEA